MWLILVLSSSFAISMAQRPTYAGTNPKGYPELASRFRDDDNGDRVTLTNRVGDGNDGKPIPNLPTDARGDADLVTRLQEWPRENQPFWLLNAEHIEKHRHPNGNIVKQQQAGPSRNDIPTSNKRPFNTINSNTPVQKDPVNNNREQVQSRFGEPIGTETRTIKPLSQRGSFAGSGRI